MASIIREQLVSTASQAVKEPDKFLLLLGKSQAVLKTILGSLSAAQCRILWLALVEVCRLSLQQLTGQRPNSCNVVLLEGILSLVGSYLDTETPAISDELMDIVLLLHDCLLTLSDLAPDLQNSISCLCERWWVMERRDRAEVVPNTVLYLLARALAGGSKVVDVQRVWQMRESLELLELQDPSAESLKSMLLTASISLPFVTCEKGHRFLSYLFTLNTDLSVDLHETIKKQLPFAPSWLLEVYGEVYMRAWHLVPAHLLSSFEERCLQDLMFSAVHAPRSGRHALFHRLRKFLGVAHQQCCRQRTQTMLARLYKPFLWRALRVANAHVRANAVTLMLDAFPLLEPQACRQDMDQQLQQQFDLIKELLTDPSMSVRLAVVRGVAQVLACYWEMIPVHVIKAFLGLMVRELAFDASSVAVRVAVLQGMAVVLENPLSHPVLVNLLPLLRFHLHDVSEKVRLAMLDLLLVVKELRTIKFWLVCPVDELLARMESDSPLVVKRVCSLLVETVSPSQPQSEQLERCVALVGTNRLASWRFYQVSVAGMSCRHVVRLIVLLLRCVTSNATASGKKLQQQQPATNGDECFDSLHPEELDSVAVATGLLEVAVILWKGSSTSLECKDNAHLCKRLETEVASSLPLLFDVFKDGPAHQCLYLLASFLPARSAGPVIEGLLEALSASKAGGDHLAVLMALVSWGCGEQVIELIHCWLEMPQSETNVVNGRRGRKRGRNVTQTALALDVLCTLMRYPMLFDKICKISKFWKTSVLLKQVMPAAEQQLTAIGPPVLSAELALQYLSTYLKMTIHKLIEMGDKQQLKEVFLDVTGWSWRVLSVSLSGSSLPQRQGKKRARRSSDVRRDVELSLALVQAQLEAMSELLLIGLSDADMESISTQFAASVVETAVVHPPIFPALCKLLYQLLRSGGRSEVTGISSPSSLAPVATVLEHLLTHLCRVANSEPLVFHKMWGVLKPVVTDAIITSLKHHAASPLQEPSHPVLTVLARTCLFSLSQQPTEIGQTLPQDLDNLPPFSAQLVGLFSQDSSSAARLFLGHIESQLKQLEVGSTLQDLLSVLQASLHIISALSSRDALGEALVHVLRQPARLIADIEVDKNSRWAGPVQNMRELINTQLQQLLHNQ